MLNSVKMKMFAALKLLDAQNADGGIQIPHSLVEIKERIGEPGMTEQFENAVFVCYEFDDGGIRISFPKKDSKSATATKLPN
jgi:hypothetical protein